MFSTLKSLQPKINKRDFSTIHSLVDDIEFFMEVFEGGEDFSRVKLGDFFTESMKCFELFA